MRPLLAIVPTLFFASHTWAADESRVNDLRFLLGISPSEYENNGNDLNADTGLRVGVQYMASVGQAQERGQWIAGAELSHTMASADAGPGGDIDITTIALTGIGGFAFRMPDLRPLHVEATGFLGLGRTSVEAGNQDNDESYWEFGPRVAAFWTFDNRCQIGADMRYIISKADELENDGVALLASLGYRF
jgi:hypothetical protein